MEFNCPVDKVFKVIMIKMLINLCSQVGTTLSENLNKEIKIVKNKKYPSELKNITISMKHTHTHRRVSKAD